MLFRSELFTAAGAVVGGLVAFLLDDRLLAGLFTLMLLYVAITMIRRAIGSDAEASATAAEAPPSGEAGGDAPGEARRFLEALSGPGYRVTNLRFGAIGAVFAGVLSAILGIGGGIVKVPLMHLAMGIPLRVATATSNLMVGITASTSAIVYLLRAGIDPYVAGPTALGVFVGAALGSRAAHRVDLRVLRLLFVLVLLYTALQMGRRATGLG